MIAIHPTDRAFTDSPDAGWPECLCSRCGEPITEADCEAEGPVIRIWPEHGACEWRYHPRCLGLRPWDDRMRRFTWRRPARAEGGP